MSVETNNPENQNTENDPKLHYWKVEQVKISDQSGKTTLDLTTAFLRLELNSSLTTPCVYGNIQIEDFADIIGSMPVMGNENLEITIKSVDGTKFNKKFKVLKIHPPMSSPAKTQKFYMIEFGSFVYYNNLKNMFSKSYRNSLPTAIVDDIYKNYLAPDEEDGKKITLEPYVDRMTSIVMPYLHPIEAISFVSKYCSLNNDYDFIFYEDFTGCNFVSMSSLKESEPVVTFQTSHDPDGRSENASGQDDIDFYRKRIISYTLAGDAYDIPRNLLEGTFAGSNINFDMTLKKVTNRIYSYHREFPRQSHVEKSPIVSKVVGDDFSGENTSKIVITFEPTLSFDRNVKTQNIVESYFRRASINNIFKQMMIIKVRSKMDLYPGQTVIIEIRTNKNNDGADSGDKYLSGKYLVLNAAHFLEKSQSLSTFVLGRDSVPETIPSEVTLTEESPTS